MKKILKIIIFTLIFSVLLIIVFKNIQMISCLIQKGSWRRIGLAHYKECNLPTSDSDKICIDESDCEGNCIIDISMQEYEKLKKELKDKPIKASGKCSKYQKIVGCNAILKNGEIKEMLCID